MFDVIAVDTFRCLFTMQSAAERSQFLLPLYLLKIDIICKVSMTLGSLG